jgi:hypothetical protein
LLAILVLSPYLLKLALPAGFLLRSFSFTRAAGNVILGITIGFIIVMPLTLSLTSNFFNSEKTLEKMRENWIKFSSKIIAIGGLQYLYSLASEELQKKGRIIPMWLQILYILFNIYVSVFVLLDLYYLTNYAMAYGMFSGFVVIPTILFVTLTVSREISKMLGTEIDLSAFLKLI